MYEQFNKQRELIKLLIMQSKGRENGLIRCLPHQQKIIFDKIEVRSQDQSIFVVQEPKQVPRGSGSTRGYSNRRSRGVSRSAGKSSEPPKQVNRRRARVETTTCRDLYSYDYVEDDNAVLKSS